MAMGLALAVPEPRVEDEGSEAVAGAVEDDRELGDEDEVGMLFECKGESVLQFR